MTDPRNEIDTWLGREVEPLPPPPGSFDRIHRRARRRKLNQALTASAGAVIVIAGAVLIPTVATGVLTGDNSSPPRSPAAAPATSRSTAPAPRSTPAATPTQHVSAAAGGTGLSAATSGAAAPVNFQPTSVTMIGDGIGAVIGQAGVPGHCGPPVADDCTSLAGTSTYGATWYGVSAPVTGVPAGSAGASQLRFLNLFYGWAFGPGLWQTSDQGRHWNAVPTRGLRVTALEAGGSRAFAVLARCAGAGRAYAAGCSTFGLYSAVTGSTTLQAVRLVIPAAERASAMGTAGQPGAAALAIAGDAASPQDGTGYLLTPAGDIVSGSVSSLTWTYQGKAPCAPGTATGTGAPLGAQLTIGADGGLLLNCATVSAPGGGQVTPDQATQAKQLWRSADGVTWTKVGQPPSQAAARSLAGTSSGQVVLATTAGIDYSPDGASWHRAAVSGGAPAGGFSYVGMTSATQGVAVPADAQLGEIFVTTDGGRRWTPSRISG
ncbi:MAG TPA: hypothetical protein VGG35_22370 [Streptosporangiaceae bacterium]